MQTSYQMHDYLDNVNKDTILPAIVRMKDTIIGTDKMSSGNRPCGLFDKKHQAIITHIYQELKNHNVECEIITNRLTTPQARNSYKRATYKVHSDNYHYIKATFKQKIDAQQVTETVFIFPYVNKILKKTCAVNLAVSTSRHAANETRRYGQEESIINIFGSNKNYTSYITKSIMNAETFEIDLGEILNLLTNYEAYVTDGAKSIVKDSKREKLKTSTVVSQFATMMSEYDMKDADEYYQENTITHNNIVCSLQFGSRLDVGCLSVYKVDNRYSRILDLKFNKNSDIKRVKELITLTKSVFETVLKKL